MVKLGCILAKLRDSQVALRRNFLDCVRVYVRGGGGGQGLPKYGGVGGRGGDVFVVAKDGTQLKDIYKSKASKRYLAGNGENSRKSSLLGKPGSDVEIAVPPGVMVVNDMQLTIGELDKDGDKVLVARGGESGNPMNRYNGSSGEKRSISLDLKLIADVGLVGFPNAGKSTLLKAVSRASPKIAAYPFTTIRPNVAVMEYTDFRQITMADLPGLIEGAHMNFGMGHNFLKHVERTKLLLFMVDVNGFQLSQKYPFRTAFQTIMLLNKEVELYKADLLAKPAVLALNKLDTEDAEEKAQEVIQKLKNAKESVNELDSEFRPHQLISFDDIILISAKQRDNTDHLKDRIRDILDYHAELQRDDDKQEKKLEEISQKLIEHRSTKFLC